MDQVIAAITDKTTTLYSSEEDNPVTQVSVFEVKESSTVNASTFSRTT